MTTTLIYADEIAENDVIYMVTGYAPEPTIRRVLVQRVRFDTIHQKVSIIARDVATLEQVPIPRDALDILCIEERSA